DNLLTGVERNIAYLRASSRFTFVQHDITQPLDLEVDEIYHLASPASPVGYWNHPFETIAANTLGTQRMLALAQRHGARLLYTSTSEAYGDPLVHPQREDYWGNVNPVGVRACYDESKRLGETLTMEYVRRYATNARIVRIFNTYGPRNQVNDGRMIPNFISGALKGEPLVIHGTGGQTRSLCYVDDLVEGLMLAMGKPNTQGEVINLGHPQEATVLEWAQLIVKLTSSSSTITHVTKREDDPDRRCPDISKARRLLGWEPRTDPSTGLTQTIAWYRDELAREGDRVASARQ
ncbi:MAG TPA: GDP-mannose 4,6-dehydratase, partial [Ktedonobacterales bacterium]